MATYNVGQAGEKIRKQILASYLDLEKAEAAGVGEIRKFGNHEYIKTEDGWKYHNQGIGKITVKPGHKLTTKAGVHGEVKHRDHTHTYIEHKTDDGKAKISKVKNEDVDNNIVAQNFQHYIPADKSAIQDAKVNKSIIGKDPSAIKTMDDAFEHMTEFFKNDPDASATVDLLKDALKDSKVEFDPEMSFSDDRVLGLFYRESGKIGVNVKSKLAGNTEEVYRTLLHETVHAATVHKIDTSATLQDELNETLEQIQEQAKKDNVDFYGLTNSHEMVAELFSNKEFYDYLKNVKVTEGKSGNKLDSVLRKLFLTIVSAFSKDAKSIKKVKSKNLDNVADYLMELTKSVIDKSNKVEKSIENELNTQEQFDIIEKGKVSAPIGSKKEFGGRMYIKTADGWKYYGKGGGNKATQHATGNTSKTKTKEKNAAVPDRSETPAPTNVADNPTVNINERFQAAARQTKAVIKGAAKCQILYGTGGVGKTYGVTHLLDAAGMKPFDEDTHKAANQAPTGDDDGEFDNNEEGEKSTDYDYIKITGKMTTPQVYKALYEHNGKVILFDDCDSVLRDGNTVNLFKGALDSSGDGTVSYGTSTGVKDESGTKLPKRFKFNGRAIFISNLPADEVPQPIKSRALRADLSMTPEQTIERLKFIAKNKEGKYQNLKFKGVPNYTHKDMEDIINFLDKHKYNTSDLNVRTVGSMLAIKHIADEEGHDWKKDAEHMIFSKSIQNDFYNGGLLKAREFNIMKSYGTDDRIQKAKNCGNMGADSEMYKGMDEDCEDDMEKGGFGSGRHVESFKKSNDDNLNKAFETLGL